MIKNRHPVRVRLSEIIRDRCIPNALLNHLELEVDVTSIPAALKANSISEGKYYRNTSPQLRTLQS